jgi:hypothetical protein
MNIAELVKKSEERNIWEVGNQVLYDLCAQHPKHNDGEEIIAKVWLIGRSYAAAIERRKTSDNYINDDYYTKNVIPKIIHSDIDKLLANIDANNDETILKVHGYLTDIFKDISGLEKRALASKYLHFHFPEIFYIYDSRAVGAVKTLKKILDLKFDHPEFVEKYDKEYSKFYFDSKWLVGYIQEKYNIKLSCRKFDNLLMEIGNEKLNKLLLMKH